MEEKPLTSLSDLGVCTTCLSYGLKMRAMPNLRFYLKMLTNNESPERVPASVCWQCEASFRSISRFQKQVESSQLALRQLCTQLSQGDDESLKPVLVNSRHRLTRSHMVTISTPDYIETHKPKNNDFQIYMLKCKPSSDKVTDFSSYNDRCQFSIDSTSVISNGEKFETNVIVSVKRESDSEDSDNEFLSDIRKVNKQNNLDAVVSSSDNNEEVSKTVTKRVKVKRKIRSEITDFEKVIVADDDNVNSDGGSVDVDDMCEKTAKVNLNNKTKRRKGKAKKVKKLKNERFRKVVISEEEMLKGREEDRTLKWYVQSPYKCATCVIGYYSESHLQDHNRLKHNPEHSHLCPVCARRLPSARQLVRHAAGHYRRIECRACGERHRAYRDLWRHYVAVHEPDKQFPCAQCGKLFQTRPSLVYHRRCEHRERSKCEYCGNTFRNQTTYKRHLLIHTGMPTYECKICERTYRGKFGYLTHMKTHGPPPRDAYCVECDVQYKHAFQYRRHLKISPKHAQLAPDRTDQLKKFACSDCEKKFISPSVLKRHHDSVHLKLKRYNCSLCDKNYATPAALWTHRKLQHERVAPPRDKVCELCGKGFRTNTTLLDHLRSHTGERPFRCDACAATFRHNSGLYMHKRLVHKMGKKRSPTEGGTPDNIRTDLPLQCKLCPATFRHTSGLYMHNRLVHKHGLKQSELNARSGADKPAPEASVPYEEFV